MDSTETLPRGVNSPAFRYGIISGVDSKYNSSGAVETLSDINTINFSSDQLKKVSQEIESLVLVLNQLSGSSRLGDQLNLGTLRIDTEPSIKYFVPIYARGITDNLSVAAAMPVVFYKNKLSLVQSSSNAAEICDKIGPSPSEDLKNACVKLSNTRMTDEVRKELANKGYRALEDRNETMMGDLQLVALYKIVRPGDVGRHSVSLRNTFVLPTGKPNDPDDLADIGYFGQTAVEPFLIYNYALRPNLNLAAKAGYKLTVPDRIDARVPKNEEDLIPGKETKEKVSRNLGDTLTLGAAATWNFYGDFGIAGGYEYARKSDDRYSGERRSRYDLLAKDTGSEAHRLRGSLSYDTIGLYMRKKNVPPMKFDFGVINTVAGRNTDRSFTNELSLTLFF
jgi:hypothetical protein